MHFGEGVEAGLPGLVFSPRVKRKPPRESSSARVAFSLARMPTSIFIWLRLASMGSSQASLGLPIARGGGSWWKAVKVTDCEMAS